MTREAIPELVVRKLSKDEPKIPPMSPERMLAIQAQLGLKWAPFCELLGCSVANMKRWKYGYADIPRYIARYLTSLAILYEAGQLESFIKKTKKY